MRRIEPYAIKTHVWVVSVVGCTSLQWRGKRSVDQYWILNVSNYVSSRNGRMLHCLSRTHFCANVDAIISILFFDARKKAPHCGCYSLLGNGKTTLKFIYKIKFFEFITCHFQRPCPMFIFTIETLAKLLSSVRLWLEAILARPTPIASVCLPIHRWSATSSSVCQKWIMCVECARRH